MSRRDTIIVAALVNAGLLIVLFVSALKSQDEGEQLVSRQASSDLIAREAVASSGKKMVGDEVDQVLKQYSQRDPLQAPIAVATDSSKSSFVDDLQGLTKVETTPESKPARVAQSNPMQEQSQSVIEIKIKKGDMLEKLARQHRTSVSSIMRLNNLSSTQLKIGQVLKVASVTANAHAQPKAALLESIPSKMYTVKSGDSPWTIAVKNHMKVEDLLRLNDISEDKARRLRPGDQLRIR